MGCVASKGVVKQLEGENKNLKLRLAELEVAEAPARIEAADDGAQAAEVAALREQVETLEQEKRVLEFKLEASYDLHSAAVLDGERSQELLDQERRVTAALKHHIVAQTPQVHDIIWGGAAKSKSSRKSSGEDGKKGHVETAAPPKAEAQVVLSKNVEPVVATATATDAVAQVSDDPDSE